MPKCRYETLCEATHGGKYKYSLTGVEKRTDKVPIICPIHGVFVQSLHDHIKGSGCPKCSGLSRKRSICFSEILKRFRDAHGDRYSYEEPSDRFSTKSKINITCPEHGSFSQEIKAHYSGQGCPACGALSRSRKQRSSPASLMASFHSVHGAKYSYIPEQVAAATSPTKLTIVCKTHGNFTQLVYNHKNGYGCPKCSRSVSSLEVEFEYFLKGLNVEYFTRDRVSAKPYELDFYIPDKKLAVELNGTYWHSSAKKDKFYHRDKRIHNSLLGIRTLTIWEDEWMYGRTKIENLVKSLIGRRTYSIPARKCEVRNVEKNTACGFLETHHLQGYGVVCKEYVGLFFKGELISVVSFKKVTDTLYELQRSVNRPLTSVQGGFSKLVSHWRIKNPSIGLVSYIDYDKFTGDSYIKAGFRKVGECVSMSYSKREKRLSRHKFMKKKLKEFKGYSDAKTEKQICEENGFLQCFNSGTGKYFLEPLNEKNKV